MTRRAVGRPWTAHEDQLLANAVAVHGQVDNWKAVALAVPGRTNKACRKRWLHSLSPSVKKSAWTREEDHLLLELYKIHSAKWAVIARNIPGRTDDACSKRYREALDPTLRKDEWTQAEDDALLAAYARLGGKWGRVGQDLQRSGLACRNRWRLLERKRTVAENPSQGPLANPVWPALPMASYWDPRSTVDTFSQDPPPPFHYASSLSSALHPIRYEKDAEPTASDGRQSLVLQTPSVPTDSTSTPVFAPFDYESSSSACALSVGSTSPAPQASHSDDMHQYSDRHHPFHQLHPIPVPVHASSAHPIQVDHYTASVPHEECLSHAALTTSHQPPQPSSLQVQNVASAYFATSHLPEQQASHMSSSVTSLVNNPDPFYNASPEPGLDVNAQHTLIHTPNPLSLSESRPGYHYAHHRVLSRARVVETLHGREQHANYYHSHVQPDQRHHANQPSRPPTSSPPESLYALQQLDRSDVNTPQPQAGPSRTPDHYYTSNPLLSSQLVRRSAASPCSIELPYPKRRPSINSEDYQQPSFQLAPKHKTGALASRKRPDTQTPSRLSSDLQATPDPSVKPYVCGHESCWPPGAASGRASYCTSRGLSDHNKTAHPEDSGGDRPYRCGLEGCGKSWKSINGLQYHLQISKAHFQHAISSSFVSSYINDLVVPASVEASTPTAGEGRTRKQYKCPHENCPNWYKQLSGLRYHLAHGHPVDLPKQLDLVPPALSRKLAEKMRVQGPAPSSTLNNGSEASVHSS